MKRTVGAVLAAILLLGGCQESTDGETLYVRNCGACHNTDLSGAVGPAVGAGSPSAAWTDAELRSIIVDGAEGMPAGSLSGEQVDAVIAYLRQVQGS